MTTNTPTQGFSPWPRWSPPRRIGGVEWTRHVGGKLYAPHAPTRTA
jgi:hypothetical protein